MFMILNPIFPKITVASIDINLYILPLLLLLMNTLMMGYKANLNLYINKEIIFSILFYVSLIIIGLAHCFNFSFLTNKLGELSSIVTYFLILIIFSTNNNKNTFSSIFNVLKLFYYFFIVTSLLEILMKIHFPVPNFTNVLIGREISIFATGIFYNPNNLSTFLLLLYMFLFNNFQSKITKVLLYIIQFFIFYTNDSNICLGLMNIFVLFILITKYKKIIARIFISLIFSLVAFIFFLSTRNELQNFQQVNENTYNVRIKLIEQGFKMAREQPMGYGPSMFNKVFNGTIDTSFVRDPHSLFIEVLTNYGIIGLFLFILFDIGLILAGYKLYKTNQFAINIFLTAIILNGLFFVMSTTINFYPIWIVINLILILSTQPEEKYSNIIKNKGAFQNESTNVRSRRTISGN